MSDRTPLTNQMQKAFSLEYGASFAHKFLHRIPVTLKLEEFLVWQWSLNASCIGKQSVNVEIFIDHQTARNPSPACTSNKLFLQIITIKNYEL